METGALEINSKFSRQYLVPGKACSSPDGTQGCRAMPGLNRGREGTPSQYFLHKNVMTFSKIKLMHVVLFSFNSLISNFIY